MSNRGLLFQLARTKKIQLKSFGPEQSLTLSSSSYQNITCSRHDIAAHLVLNNNHSIYTVNYV